MSQSSICDCSNLTALPRGAFGSGLLRVQTRGVQAPGASRAILSCAFVHSRVVGYCRSPQHLSRSCGHSEGARVLGTIDSAQTAPLRSWTSSFRYHLLTPAVLLAWESEWGAEIREPRQVPRAALVTAGPRG